MLKPQEISTAKGTIAYNSRCKTFKHYSIPNNFKAISLFSGFILKNVPETFTILNGEKKYYKDCFK